MARKTEILKANGNNNWSKLLYKPKRERMRACVSLLLCAFLSYLLWYRYMYVCTYVHVCTYVYMYVCRECVLHKNESAFQLFCYDPCAYVCMCMYVYL